MPPKLKRNVSDEDLLNAREAEKEKLLRDSDDDDDFFLKGPSSSSRTLTIHDDKLRQVQVQIEEVSSAMKDNIYLIERREGKLEDLEDKSELLSTNAENFRSTARKMQSRMWWRNVKLKVMIAVLVIVVLLIIIVPIIMKNK